MTGDSEFPIALQETSAGILAFCVERMGHRAAGVHRLPDGATCTLAQGEGPPFECRRAGFFGVDYAFAVGGGVVADQLRCWSLHDGQLLSEIALGDEYQFAAHPLHPAFLVVTEGRLAVLDPRGATTRAFSVPEGLTDSSLICDRDAVYMWSWTGDFARLDLHSGNVLDSGRLDALGIRPSKFESFQLSAATASGDGFVIAASVLGSREVMWRDARAGTWDRCAVPTAEVRHLRFSQLGTLLEVGGAEGEAWYLDLAKGELRELPGCSPFCVSRDERTVVWYEGGSLRTYTL